MSAFVTVPYIHFDAADVSVHDRTADLHSVIVELAGFGAGVHIDDAAAARELAAAFTKAAEFLEQAQAGGAS